MEAKLILNKRYSSRNGNVPLRSAFNFRLVHEKLQGRLKAACTVVWNLIKTRDPFFDFFFAPKKIEDTPEGNRIFICGKFAAIIPGNSTAEYVIANGFLNFLNLYSFALVGRLILTWFPSRPPALERPLSTICDPYLNLFRGIIPPLGNIDFSPILAFIVLNVFTNAAAAIPAEISKSKRNKKNG